MGKTNRLICLLVGFILLYGCEIPKKPDFTTSHKIEAPLLFDKEYQFLGGEGALLDTTKSEFDSLFTVLGNEQIVISIEEDFDFGDLDDAIPVVNVDPTSFQSQVGELEIGSFSSGNGNLGTASFEDLTGFNPALVPSGTPIVGGTTPSPVIIDVGNNTDFFASATVKSGGIEVAVTNSLGFDISNIGLKLMSGSTEVTTGNLTDVNHGETTSTTLGFNEGDVLSDLKIEVTVTWVAQNTSAEPGELVVENIVGDNLVASAVEAALEPQDFSSSNTSNFDASEFDFGTDDSYYVELKSGDLTIAPIQNGLDITIENLTISFPGIRSFPYGEADSLVITYSNSGGVDERILRSSSSVEKNIDLSGYRLFAPNNEISYTISAITENTQDAPSSDQMRVLSEDQEISSSVEISNLVIKEAFGIVKQQNVLLNTDEGGDEILDIFNDQESELTEIDGLEDLSKQLDGLDFTNPRLTINYDSNIGIATTIYGVFVGTNGNDEQVFLSGSNRDGTFEVDPTDPISGLHANGIQLTADQMIKFELEKVIGGGTASSSITFNKDNTNVDEFLNNLPSEIRFIGKAVVNQNEQEGIIGDSLVFEPMISVDLPLTFTSTGSTFKDTTDQDLSNLPSSLKGDDSQITKGEIVISYSNGLPIGFDLEINFLDSLDNNVTTIPLSTDDPLNLAPSEIDPVTSFSSTATNGSLIVALNADQLKKLYRTKKLEVNATLITTSVNGVNQSVKLRSTDKITLSVRANISIETDVKL